LKKVLGAASYAGMTTKQVKWVSVVVHAGHTEKLLSVLILILFLTLHCISEYIVM